MEKIGALVLAGGKSSRMGGTHKGNLKIGNETFQEHVIRALGTDADEILLSYATVIQSENARCRIIMDEVSDCGPIGGLYAGLKAAHSEILMVSACDLPYIAITFYRYLYERMAEAEKNEKKEYQGVVPVIEGRMHPLAAIYRKSVIPILEQQMKDHNYRVTSAVQKMDVLYVDLTENDALNYMVRNVNTREEYKKLTEEGES